MHHYSYPPAPYENSPEFYYPPPSSASFHSNSSLPPSYSTYPTQQIEDIQNNNIHQFLQQQQHFQENDQPNQHIQLYGENGELIDENKWKEQFNSEVDEDENTEKLNFQKDNLQQENVDELTIDDLAHGENKLEHIQKQNQIEETTDNTDNKEILENSENPEKLENQQNTTKNSTNDEGIPKPKLAKLPKPVSKWIHSEDSSDEDRYTIFTHILFHLKFYFVFVCSAVILLMLYSAMTM